jgi:hypothetical protein
MFLKAAMQIANMGPHLLHQLPIQHQLKPQHPVRTGMLRPHLQDEIITLSFVTHPVFVPYALR